jgi:light-regulated signal transduction histidine kinase (bacteriophytochrome)
MSYDRNTIDLTNCDREPIHIPGSVQPHGALIVVDPQSNLVMFASENVTQYLGGGVSEVIGQKLDVVVGPEVAHEIGNALARGGSGEISGVVLHADIGNGKRADLTIHRHQNRVLLEFETAASPRDTEIALTLTQSLVRRIDKVSEVGSLVNSVAKLIRAMLGYDRVMVYQFLHNGAGRVVAEAKTGSLDSFMGQHFPYSDIPAQARRLYLENWIRVIGDVSFAPIPLWPDLKTDEPSVDMSHAHLRSVSPIHCEYLQNMGVGASMSISIVVNGELWGLIACHHNTPKVLSIPLRVATELFAQYFALQIAAAENRHRQKAAALARGKLDAIIAGIDPKDSIDFTLKTRLRDFGALVSCDGIGLWTNDEWTAVGAVPSGADIPGLMTFLADAAPQQIWETQDLKSKFAEGEYGERVAGAMAIPVSAAGNAHLIFFRSEEAHEITWAGEPTKKIVPSALGDRLTPRGSFETWREDVRNKSVPWSEDDRVVADAIRNYVRDIMLRHNDATEEQREKADQQRKLLNAELNHRVKNILALVKSIAAQTGANALSVDEYAQSFEGRLRALSYAHDQSFAGHDGGELSSLIEAEASMHRFQQAPDRVSLEGPPIGLSERAFGVFALLLHEMMTNATKYGGLSAPTGRLDIRWKLLANGDCELGWTESGGPKVVAPSRKGFGSTLIDRTISFDLGGIAELDFASEGLKARFVIPANHLHPVSERKTSAQPGIVAGRPLVNLKVMLVEDQALIALDTEELLRELGADEVVTSPDVATALNLLMVGSPDVAVLDLNLGNETSEAIADSLDQKGVPFVFATGYQDSATIPARFADVPVVRKPISPEALATTLTTALKVTSSD